MDGRRVAVEVGVIVASILMAFGIDAWWDLAQSRAAEREFLERVSAELTEARPSARAAIGVAAGRLSS